MYKFTFDQTALRYSFKKIRNLIKMQDKNKRKFFFQQNKKKTDNIEL